MNKISKYISLVTFKRILLSIVFLSGLLPLSCKPQQQQAPPVPQVSVVTVKPQPVELTTELPGRTSAYTTAEIRPRINGLIEKRLFTEGSDVKEGQVLYQIDQAPFKAALDNANASLKRAEASMTSIQLKTQRYKDLLKEKAVSQQDYDDASSSMNQVQAEIQFWKAMVDTANINLGYTHVTAPISGRIGRSNVTDGDIVTAYQATELATIQQLDPIYVDVPQSTSELLRLNTSLKNGSLKGDGLNQNKVKLMLENGIEYPPEGTLQFRDVTVEQTTGSVILRIVFPNPDDILLPGMFVRAIVKEGVLEQAILIPQQAVSRDVKGNPIAMIVDKDDKIQMRMLTLDRAINDKWLVTSGLEPNDRVVMEGIQKVRPGDSVKAVEFMENKTKPSASEKTPQPATKAK